MIISCCSGFQLVSLFRGRRKRRRRRGTRLGSSFLGISSQLKSGGYSPDSVSVATHTKLGSLMARLPSRAIKCSSSYIDAFHCKCKKEDASQSLREKRGAISKSSVLSADWIFHFIHNTPLIYYFLGFVLLFQGIRENFNRKGAFMSYFFIFFFSFVRNVNECFLSFNRKNDSNCSDG